MQINKSLLAFIFFILSVTAATGYGSDSLDNNELTIRAKTEQLPEELVKYLAENSATNPQEKIELKSLDVTSVKALITKKCGSVQPGYIEVLAAKNGLGALDLDSSLDRLPEKVLMPNCLYVSSYESNDAPIYKVQTGDNQSFIYNSFTGGGYNSDAIVELTGDFRKIMPGDEIPIRFATAPSNFTFIHDQKTVLNHLKKFSYAVSIKIDNEPEVGEIIVPFDYGEVSQTFERCSAGKNGYPYLASYIDEAYTFNLSMPYPKINHLKIAIVDNGFLGVEVDRYRKLHFKWPFDESLFLLDDFPNLGPVLFESGPIEAINYLNNNKLEVNPISGHGTHVAGLVIGGVVFKDYFQSYVTKRLVNISLIPINLNKGEKLLPQGSEIKIFNALTANVATIPDIVNLSIAFNAGSANLKPPTVARNLRVIFTNDNLSRTLFIVSAGNHGKDLNGKHLRISPAVFGGKNSTNVISVASHDDNGRISHFSNYAKESVDIAAPGCQVDSWLNSNITQPLSGTSQAAPLVSFAATLLRSKWGVEPTLIKNRIIYSGDLIEDPQEREKVRSKSLLNIAKTLFINYDYIAVIDEKRVRYYLGEMAEISQLSCDGHKNSFEEWTSIHSLKRAPDGSMYIFSGDKFLESIEPCLGTLRNFTSEGAINLINFTPKFEIESGRVIKVNEGNKSIPSSNLIEFIRDEFEGA